MATKKLIRHFLCTLLLSAIPVLAQEHADQISPEPHVAQPVLSGHIHSGWESHYYSEGRDSLNGDDLWTNSIELAWNALTGQVWYASSPQQDYDELHLILVLNHRFGPVDAYVLYKRLEFPTDNAHDTEISTGLGWTGLPFAMELTVDATYAFDARGSFFELGVHRGFAINEQFGLTASGSLGVNDGFVSDGHSGANHFRVAVESEYAVTGSFALTTHAAYSWAVNANASLAGDDQLDDFFHGGIGIRWSF